MNDFWYNLIKYRLIISAAVLIAIIIIGIAVAVTPHDKEENTISEFVVFATPEPAKSMNPVPAADDTSPIYEGVTYNNRVLSQRQVEIAQRFSIHIEDVAVGTDIIVQKYFTRYEDIFEALQAEMDAFDETGEYIHMSVAAELLCRLEYTMDDKAELLAYLDEYFAAVGEGAASMEYNVNPEFVFETYVNLLTDAGRAEDAEAMQANRDMYYTQMGAGE